MRNAKSSGTLLGLCILFTTGCSEEKPQFVPKKIQAVADTPVDSGFVLVSREEVFAAKMKAIEPKAPRDIFKEIKLISGPAVAGTGTPLETYELAQLTLVGVIFNIASPKALVRAPNGEEFVATLNTAIGKRGGRVVAVLSDQIVIEEKFYDFRGELTEERYVLKLPTADGVSR